MIRGGQTEGGGHKVSLSEIEGHKVSLFENGGDEVFPLVLLSGGTGLNNACASQPLFNLGQNSVEPSVGGNREPVPPI